VAKVELAELGPGDLLGRYQIVEAISRGATGAVYRAHDEQAGADLAIKRMFETGNTARFEIESRMLSRLAHPRVVEILDYFEDASGMYCIVMRLVRGIDLGRMLWDRGAPGLPVGEVLEWTRQACEALQYTHDQQIVHGDVKPQNLIVGGDGVVLVDFGAAAQLDAQGTGFATLGTARFMAPEVFAGGVVSSRSDVFSIAATVWTLLTGTPPAYGEDTNLANRVPGVSDQLELALAGGLEMVPEQRITSPSALADALGAPLHERHGASLGLSIDSDGVDRSMLEEVVRTAAGVFDAAAASVALLDEVSDELVYEAAWGAGAHEIVGLRLSAGVGVAGVVIATGDAQAVPDCRRDDRFAAEVARGTGYVPHTMLAVPLRSAGVTVGVLSILDRRDGNSYEPPDIRRAQLFGQLALAALRVADRP
jgi:hypothetical protein